MPMNVTNWLKHAYILLVMHVMIAKALRKFIKTFYVVHKTYHWIELKQMYLESHTGLLSVLAIQDF